jgi:chromosome segregation ATPase
VLSDGTWIRTPEEERDQPAAPAPTASEARVRELESELTDLRRSYSENTEKMILAEARVRELEAENTTLRVNNRVLEADSADLLERRRAAESELAALRERVADARRKLTCPNRSDPTRVKDALEVLRGR